jgi:hypothetical protein
MNNCRQCLIDSQPWWKDRLEKVTLNTYGLCADCRRKLDYKQGNSDVKSLMGIFGIKE